MEVGVGNVRRCLPHCCGMAGIRSLSGEPFAFPSTAGTWCIFRWSGFMRLINWDAPDVRLMNDDLVLHALFSIFRSVSHPGLSYSTPSLLGKGLQ